MDEKTPVQRLKYGGLLLACSLFSQWFLWFLHGKLEFPMPTLAVLPLLLCAMYHLMQMESGEGKLFRRGFVFRWTVLLPLVLGIALAVYMWGNFPDLAVFEYGAPLTGAPREIIACYAARFILTSLYLLIFSGLDALYFLIWGDKSNPSKKEDPRNGKTNSC